MNGLPAIMGGSLAERRPPRCPPFVDVTSVEDLLPYVESVARRPYGGIGLHVGWDLHAGERILVRTDSWYDPMCVEAVVRTLEKFGCDVTVDHEDRGTPRRLDGHEEVEIFLNLTREISLEWMDQWREIERSGKYDKLLWGFGGPVLSDSTLKVQRLPFMSKEMLATPANTIPLEVLRAIDEWTWDMFRQARRVRVTDPEGTDLTYTNHDEYFNTDRTEINPELLDLWVPSNASLWRTYLPGHVPAKSIFPTTLDDAEGVIAGTMNHIGPFPRISMSVERGMITEIREGGLFGDKLRALKEETDDVRYPGNPNPGLMNLWEVAVGTNPKVHRIRENFLTGWNCGLFERMRSGVIHLGFGTVISTDLERQAAAEGKKVGHWHVHLYFPTVRMEMADGSEQLLIEDGRHKALDDERVREIAAKYGDPDVLLSEDWIPAVPGLNMDGDYFRDYASDPTDWTLTELHVCRKWHNLFMKMVAPGGTAGASCH